MSRGDIFIIPGGQPGDWSKWKGATGWRRGSGLERGPEEKGGDFCWDIRLGRYVAGGVDPDTRRLRGTVESAADGVRIAKSGEDLDEGVSNSVSEVRHRAGGRKVEGGR